ncbi:HyaD/HybD family hydrogenase maturation endopeptidase [Helicobacter sp. 13S00477-4]|uniref:HyaD/HybD family hydrogenase maturation endopeptidase n=1 Tax=Helicobacter sp. 13S00477-4 TaxID=1905759 RepID=UPI000BA51C48|nr:HyaD/HybD family hydrogenase maturation endopeptidase [Helicobacter sp. 13S00477-4]PAF52549.1 hydrogenase expression/formation protein [Helicobacter sp. 13S00477-4]
MKILILGIGNILFGDEGIGVHLSNLLKLNYKLSGQHQIDIIDGGTMAATLIPIIISYDRVLILDCVSVENECVGEVYFFDFDNVPETITWAGSAHEVEMLQTLKLTALLEDLPPVKIIGIIPEVIGENTTFELSNKVKKGSVLAEKLAITYLQELGVKIEKIGNKDLQDIANFSFKGY